MSAARLPGRYARGFDELPRAVLEHAALTLPRSLEPPELRRALRSAIGLLVAEAVDIETLPLVVPTLEELAGLA